MTLKELKAQLLQYRSVSECDVFLQNNLHHIRPLFYSVTHSELTEYDLYFDYEDIFNGFYHNVGRELRSVSQPPLSIIALLIFFVAVFEKARLYAKIQDVINLLPASSLRDRLDVLLQYKYIQDTQKDYLNRFEKIISTLQNIWQNGECEVHEHCEALLREYALDAMLTDGEIRRKVIAQFQHPVTRQTYRIVSDQSLQSLFDRTTDDLACERNKTHAHIIRLLHDEACQLVPNVLLVPQLPNAEETLKASVWVRQQYTSLPDFLNKQLDCMDAVYAPKQHNARFNFDSDDNDNCVYLGTYYPRTVIESWNIFSELFSIQTLRDALKTKNCLRILDIGSGTGGAVMGMLLALENQREINSPVSVTVIDTNQNALDKQNEILAAVRDNFSFIIELITYQQRLPFDTDGFVKRLRHAIEKQRSCYDIVLCWKCLNEFYNYDYVNAQGIIRHTLNFISEVLDANGLCVLADVTTKDNNYEYFPIIFNREAQQYDASSHAAMRTIIPVPCAIHSSCSNCYTQRRFHIETKSKTHISKITYRAFAPTPLASNVIAAFPRHSAYKVNAASPENACINGRGITTVNNSESFCGYTDFQ